MELCRDNFSCAFVFSNELKNLYSHGLLDITKLLLSGFVKQKYQELFPASSSCKKEVAINAYPQQAHDKKAELVKACMTNKFPNISVLNSDELLALGKGASHSFYIVIAQDQDLSSMARCIRERNVDANLVIYLAPQKQFQKMLLKNEKIILVDTANKLNDVLHIITEITGSLLFETMISIDANDIASLESSVLNYNICKFGDGTGPHLSRGVIEPHGFLKTIKSALVIIKINPLSQNKFEILEQLVEEIAQNIAGSQFFFVDHSALMIREDYVITFLFGADADSCLNISSKIRIKSV